MNWLIPISASCWRSQQRDRVGQRREDHRDQRRPRAAVTRIADRATGEPRAREQRDRRRRSASARSWSAPGRPACRPSSRRAAPARRAAGPSRRGSCPRCRRCPAHAAGEQRGHHDHAGRDELEVRAAPPAKPGMCDDRLEQLAEQQQPDDRLDQGDQQRTRAGASSVRSDARSGSRVPHGAGVGTSGRVSRWRLGGHAATSKLRPAWRR